MLLVKSSFVTTESYLTVVSDDNQSNQGSKTDHLD